MIGERRVGRGSRCATALLLVAFVGCIAGCYAANPSIPCTPCTSAPCATGTVCELGYCVAPGEDARRCPPIGSNGATGGSTTGATTSHPTSGTAGTAGSTGTAGTTGAATSSGAATNGTTGVSSTVSCARADGASTPLLADTQLLITCTGPAGGHYLVTGPSFFQLSNDLDASGRLTVTLPSAALAPGFNDQSATIHIDHSSGAGATVTLDLVGNLLVGGSEGVVALASNGTVIGALVPASQAGTVSMLARLGDGSILVGSADRGVQAVDLNGTQVTRFDSVNHANLPLFSGDLAPWGGAGDPEGNVWVTANSPSSSDNDAIFKFTSAGSFVGTVDAPGDLGGNPWIPLGVAQLSDGTMAVANAGFYGQATLALFATSGVTLDVTLPFGDCTDPGSGAPVCQAGSQGFYGTASGVLVRDGVVLVSTQAQGPAPSYVGAFSDPALSFLFSTARPTGEGAGGIVDNAGFNGLADDGVYVVVSQASSNDPCLVALDPRTLFIPDNWPDAHGCLPPNLSPAPRPVVLHLGP